MKMFCIQPEDGIGHVFHVCAKDKEEALSLIIACLKINSSAGYYKKIYESWEGATVDNLPYGYEWRTLELGQVSEFQLNY